MTARGAKNTPKKIKPPKRRYKQYVNDDMDLVKAQPLRSSKMSKLRSSMSMQRIIPIKIILAKFI